MVYIDLQKEINHARTQKEIDELRPKIVRFLRVDPELLALWQKRYHKIVRGWGVSLVEDAINEEIAKYDESVQVSYSKNGYKVLHNDKEVYFAHHLNDGAKEEATREAKSLINKLKNNNKTVYVSL